MTAHSKNPRVQAEISFGRLQTRSLAADRIVSEQDAQTHARNAKTARLRELRLEKEAGERAAASSLPATKKAR